MDLPEFEKLNTTLIKPGRRSREACTLAVAAEWKGGGRQLWQATHCKSLGLLCVFSRVLEGLRVTLKSPERRL
ncbi:hypothetical protein CesoFtcFv8_012930 [Champsocephalus esox]|uniref:Uncharacterized protein n=1 Tax=Champsocephalus esox TaxID=159716 RepID=A0AAN8GW03_9TELE|nr:hypothetical protein CesoFtcFv8_012930 [Champsocephalus esox]